MADSDHRDSYILAEPASLCSSYYFLGLSWARELNGSEQGGNFLIYP